MELLTQLLHALWAQDFETLANPSMEAMGVPGFLLPLTILLEFGGGLAVLFGFLTRTTALFTAGFTVLTAFLFHSNFAEGVNSLMFMRTQRSFSCWPDMRPGFRVCTIWAGRCVRWCCLWSTGSFPRTIFRVSTCRFSPSMA